MVLQRLNDRRPRRVCRHNNAFHLEMAQSFGRYRSNGSDGQAVLQPEKMFSPNQLGKILDRRRTEKQNRICFACGDLAQFLAVDFARLQRSIGNYFCDLCSVGFQCQRQIWICAIAPGAVQARPDAALILGGLLLLICP